MKLKKLYEDNKWWNDWKFQLHWNNLEWLDPRTLYQNEQNLFSLFKRVLLR